MSQTILIDTSVLIALLSRSDRYHQWAVNVVSPLSRPFLTCEAVITETCFLLKRNAQSSEKLFALFNRGALAVPFVLATEFPAISSLMIRYQSISISLADACLVRMAELFPDSQLLTLDSDFQIYRMNENRLIPTITAE